MLGKKRVLAARRAGSQEAVMSRLTQVVARSAAANQLARLLLTLGALAVAVGIIQVRPAAAQAAAAADTLPAAELEELVGPIALYPDDLVAIVLPASTYPLQIVEAARFLEARKADPKLKPDEDWDDSVVALLNYPEVIKLLNDDLDWTGDLGTAVLNQQPDVLDAIQGFRDRAYTAGNLRSDDRQVVTADEGTIAIAPADPEVIYVPYYEPRRVVVYQTTPVYNYYPWGYPVYYYPYPAGYAFHTGFFWGVTSAFYIGWHTHNVHVHPWGYYGHPYYGWTYYNSYYVRNPVYVNVNHGGNAWQPNYGHGSRPVVRGTEGRVTDRGGNPGGSGVVAGSSYRSQNQNPAGRSLASRSSDGATAATRTRPERGVGTVAGSQRTTTSTFVPRDGAASALHPRSNSTGAARTAPTGNERVGGGAAPTNRTRPSAGQGQTAQSSRVAPSPRTQSPAFASPRPSSPMETSRSTRVYRSAPPQATARSGNAASPGRSYSSAPRAAAPSSSGMSAAPRSNGAGGGSYRGGSSQGGQPHQGARAAGQGRSAQR